MFNQASCLKFWNCNIQVKNKFPYYINVILIQVILAISARFEIVTIQIQKSNM